ncbi:hypothetical protein [Rubritalea marina]|uniref:hypothetical protein n=1 Tax=Rubritalea marina TaxID=361055 RepID=UPI000373C1AD|nr:hypothetical protein [Rubritalea marina]
MEIVIQNPLHEELCAPITSGHHMTDIDIGNISLKELVATELRRAGFSVIDLADCRPSTVHLPLDHWIDVGALCMLSREDPGTCLYDSEGDLVAWKGCDSPDQCSNKMVTEANCFRMRYPWEILQLNSQVVATIDEPYIQGEVSPLAEVDGILHLGEGSRILPGVVIEGNVTIGSNCKIGPNAYIRGDTSIGNSCIIGNAVEVKNSMIGPNTEIAHLSYVGDSVIGSHVKLGAGTLIANSRHDGKNHQLLVDKELLDTGLEKFGAIIGDGVKTGVNTVIYPGRRIGNGRTTMPSSTVDRDMI